VYGCSEEAHDTHNLLGRVQPARVDGAGLRADEAKSINMSLTMLGMCINARAGSATAHAPYRDSKLTRLLKV